MTFPKQHLGSAWHAKVASLISIYQIAEEHDISVRTLRRMQAAGKMPGREKLGRKKLYRRDDIERLFGKKPTETL